jgi:hypothetical protein
MATPRYVIKHPMPRRLLFNFGIQCKIIHTNLGLIYSYAMIVAISNIKVLGNSIII